jgi:hypothetical protein
MAPPSVFARSIAPLVLVSCLAFAATPAAASIHRNTSAGGACKSAAAGSTAFTFGNTYLLNKATTYDYVICQFTQLDFGDDHLAPERLDVYFTAGATGGTPVCVVQMGWYWGELHTSAVVARSVVMAAGASDDLTWLGSDLPRTAAAYTLTLNCKMPPGFKLGLIGLRESDPSAGTAWVPVP